MMAEENDRRGHGPGFILGAIVGALAGAAAALLLSPPSAEEAATEATELSSLSSSGAPEAPPAYMTASEDESLARVRAMLERVRSRMREAGDAGRGAAQEQEQSLNARLAELTHGERPGPTSG